MGLHRSSARDAFSRNEKRFKEGLNLSLGDMLKKLLDRKWTFLAIVAVCIGLSVSYVVMSSPVYHAEALVKVAERKTARNAQDSYVAFELKALRSRSVMLKAMDATVAQAVVSLKHPVPLAGGFLSTILQREANGLVFARLEKTYWSWGGEHVVFKAYEVPESQLEKALELDFLGHGKWVLKNAEGRELLSGSVGTLAESNGFKVEISEIVAHPKTAFTVTRELTSTRLEQIDKVFSATETKQSSGVIRLSYEDVDPVFAARFVNAMAAAYLASNAKGAHDATIVDEALVPVRPIKPNRSSILLLGAVFGVVLGFVVTQLIPFLSRRVRDPKRLEKIIGIQTLGVIPISPHQREAIKAGSSPFMLSREQSNTPLVKALEALVQSLQLRLKSKERAKVVLVTSPVPGQGKSMLSANLAYLFAMRGLKTLLINADHRHSSLNCEEGLAEVLQGKIDPAKGIDQPFENLYALAAGNSLAAQLRNGLGLERVEALIESLRARYDMIVIDSAPVLPITDATALSKVADATILIARQGMVSYAQVAQSVSRLHKAGANIDGLVFNGSESAPLREAYRADTYPLKALGNQESAV
jgi:capsular exopolysaccharide synthesis family protein